MRRRYYTKISVVTTSYFTAQVTLRCLVTVEVFSMTMIVPQNLFLYQMLWATKVNINAQYVTNVLIPI